MLTEYSDHYLIVHNDGPMTPEQLEKYWDEDWKLVGPALAYGWIYYFIKRGWF